MGTFREAESPEFFVVGGTPLIAYSTKYVDRYGVVLHDVSTFETTDARCQRWIVAVWK